MTFWTLVHGLGFGALYLLACSGAIVGLYRFAVRDSMPGSAFELGPRATQGGIYLTLSHFVEPFLESEGVDHSERQAEKEPDALLENLESWL